jgi:hypothetical protein
LFADTHRTQKHAWGSSSSCPSTLPDAHHVLAWLRLAQLHKNATIWQDFLQVSKYAAENSPLRKNPHVAEPSPGDARAEFSTTPLLGIELCGKPTRPGAFQSRAIRRQARAPSAAREENR